MDYVCVPFRGWMGKTKDVSAFKRGSRCQAHRVECVRNSHAAGFFTLNSFPCVSRMVHHLKHIRQTWHHCGNHWSQHGPAFLWNAFDTFYSPRPKEVRQFWGQRGVQFNIRKVFLMFCTLSVSRSIHWFNTGWIVVYWLWHSFSSHIPYYYTIIACLPKNNCTVHYPWISLITTVDETTKGPCPLIECPPGGVMKDIGMTHFSCSTYNDQ